MANAERRITEARDGAAARRTWEPMALKRIGAFEDVLRGPSGMGADANTKMA